MPDHAEITLDTSDGFHTFRELHDHRHSLFLMLLVLAAGTPGVPWWSRQHEDGGDPMYGGYIIAGMTLPDGPISYHLPERYASLLEVTRIPELEHAPPWDGHTSADVAERLQHAIIRAAFTP